MKGSTVKISCTLKYYFGGVVEKVFWTKIGTETTNLCLTRIQCRSEGENTHSITFTNVTEADDHIYYCSSIMTKENVITMGFPGVQLHVTGKNI